MTGRPMHVETHANAEALLGAAEGWLLEREVESNIVLASAYLLVEGDHPFAEPYFLATIMDAHRVAGVAVRTPPDSLHLTVMPRGAASLLVEPVAGAHPSLPSVSGPVEPAEEFAAAWLRGQGGSAVLRHHWQLYVLERVRPLERRAPGRLRLAVESDLPRLKDWGPRYQREVNTRVDVTAFLERMMAGRRLHLWDDGGARCLVVTSGRTRNGLRVAAVYTPDEHRSRGYASTAVAEATSAALDSGLDFCMLVAETKDEVPNRIYRRLGFEPVREQVMIDLVSEET